MKTLLAAFAALTLLALPGSSNAQDEATQRMIERAQAAAQLHGTEIGAAAMKYSYCNQVCATQSLQCQANRLPEGQCGQQGSQCNQSCVAAYNADLATSQAKYDATRTGQ